MVFQKSLLLIGSLFLCGSAYSATCETTVVGGSAKLGPMAFDTKEITIPSSCKTFKITLENQNPAAMAKAAMGHNLVISEAAKMQGVVTKSVAAGLAKEYLAADSGYLVATKLLGPGEKDTIELDMSKVKGKALKFFCTFPGHSGIMVGDIKVEAKKVN